MTATLFLIFVAIMVTALLALVVRYRGRRAGFHFLSALLAWLLYVGVMSYVGIVANTTLRPPGAAFIFLPMVAFLIYVIVRSAASTRIAVSFPLWILLGLQCFRVGVEIFLHQLWIDGLIPRMLTFSGANLDIYIGATAPLIAWLSMRGRSGLKLALAWNVLGLIVLANVVVHAVLTSPGPLNRIHAEVPNLMIGSFPYTFIPGFFVPLAVVLHVLAMRSICSRLSEIG